MTFRHVAVLALLLSAACSTGREGDSPTMGPPQSRESVAMEFAEALVQDDFGSARDLVCPGLPDPQGSGEFPYEDARIVAPPDSEPPPGLALTITDPAPDLYVPFEGTENGTQVTGAIGVNFGEESCVTLYDVTRAFVE